ncbi:hypothetical protein FSARC_2604 [Fusarium sarcochroum]|uniref:Apple domain-containing protein n=1 Tax=Fusarium sarcochroum TaxID=1208366 RepID=A0A8H4U5V0_9HYPO|nr:hypothetical protein FSARC_2604 [Fusarium sarcochroum]
MGNRATTVFITKTEIQYSADPIETKVETLNKPAETVYKYQGPQKRGLTNPVLYKLERQHRKSVVSAACRCVYNPRTKTVTRTAGVTQQATSVITKGPISTVVVTETQYVPVTQQVDVTITEGPTNTQTVVTTTTITGDPVIKPAICNAKGFPGANAFNYNANFNSDLRSCILSCKADRRCLAIGFYLVTDPGSGSATGTCRLYDKPVADTADLGPGYYNFSDKDCPATS